MNYLLNTSLKSRAHLLTMEAVNTCTFLLLNIIFEKAHQAVLQTASAIIIYAFIIYTISGSVKTIVCLFSIHQFVHISYACYLRHINDVTELVNIAQFFFLPLRAINLEVNPHHIVLFLPICRTTLLR